MSKGTIFIVIVLLLFGTVFAFNMNKKSESTKIEEKNEISNRENDKVKVEEQNEDEALEKVDDTKIDIRNEEIDMTDPYDVSEKFVEAILVLRSGEDNAIAMQRMKKLASPEYYSKAEKIFSGREKVILLNAKKLEAVLNKTKTEAMPKGYKAIRVDYIVNVQYPDSDPEIENSNYTVHVKEVDGKYIVTSISA